MAASLDLTDPASIDAFVDAAEAAYGPVEVLISNAGEVLPTLAHETEPAQFAQQVQVNLLGAQHLISRVVPGMVERGRGDIVIVTSDVVRAPRPRMSSYVAAKWGLEGLARAMQMELEGTGVRVSIVSPGPTTTGQGSTWDGPAVTAVLDDWAKWGLVRHNGYLRPSDVAAAVVHCANLARGTHRALIEVRPAAPPAPPGGLAAGDPATGGPAWAQVQLGSERWWSRG